MQTSRQGWIKLVTVCVLGLALTTGCANLPTQQLGSQSPQGIPPRTGNAQAPAASGIALSSGTHYQSIGWLGVNANVHSWNNGELRPAIDQIADLGPITWRVIIDRADWEPTQHGDPLSYDWAYYDAIYDHGKMADLWNTIGYINSKPGQQVSINVMGGVPAWMGGTSIEPRFEDYWVRMISSMVYYGRVVKKLDFTLLGPMNEPDLNGIEGPQVDPIQYTRLLHKLAQRLDGLGLGDIRFVGPDTANTIAATDRYLPAMDKDPLVSAKLAHVGIHSYNGNAGGMADALSESQNPAMDFWVTEFSGDCPGCDTGAPNPGNWDTARTAAEASISLLTSGASGLQFYDAWDGYYEHHQSVGYWGALAYDTATRQYVPRKSYYVLKQLMKFSSPHDVRIAADSTQKGILAVAFMNSASGNITLFGMNLNKEKQNVTLSLTGSTHPVAVRVFQTSKDENMTQIADAQITNGSVSFQAAPDSVFTLTSAPA